MLRRLLFILIVCWFKFLSAQNPYYYQVNDENGAPSNEVYCTAQDSSGFVWIGCEAGLYRFDGFNFKRYAHKDQNGKAVSSLKFDSRGRLWCQNFAGQIYLVKNDSLTIYADFKDRIKSHPGFDINEQGELFVGLPDNIVKITDGKQTEFHLDHVDHIHDIKCIGNDSLLIQSGTGIFLFNEITQKILEDNTVYGQFHACWLDKKAGGLMLTSNNKEQKYTLWETENLRPLFSNYKPIGHPGYCLWYTAYVTTDGYIWICTSEGAWCFNRNTGALEMNLFEGEKISNLMIDREGNFWFTSLENGIYVVPEIAMKIFNEENAALIDQNISSVYLMNDSLLAVGAFDGSAFILNTLTDEIEFLPRQDGLRYRTASAILLKGNELIISRNFISVINLQQKTEKTFTYTYLRDIAFDGNTLFFASSDGAGFFNFQEMKESGKMNYKIISDESSKLVECDTVRHVVWFVQSNGLAQYNGDSLIYQEVKGNRIYPSALFFHNNVLWAGTSGEGIYGFENNELKYHLESGNVLSGNSISALYVNDSILACASEKGVNLIYYKTQRKFLLDLTDGINTRDINSLSINKDYIFIGCTRGLYAYPLSKLRRNTIPLELTIEAVYVGNEFQKDKSIIKINDGEDLRIFFRSASFRSRGNFEFRYMMTNQPGGWNYLDGKSREIYFNNLASGEYDLLLDAVNEDGVSCQNPLRIHLVVRPPFWQRWWFYALIALISLTVAAVFYNIRIKSIRRKALLKEKVIRYQLRAIKAQMNPHFIFNSLTSIQDLILQQDYQNSYSYLTKFSGILRMVLDFSESDEVSLADEIRFLNTYLILEKLRFGNEFSYSIVLKSDSDSQYINIPPLLIQPFVENAIKHGLLHKKGDKKLEVNFEVIDTANKKRKIICTITDNGVGRKRASEINLKREPNHHSFATKATEQRLDLLNSREDYQVEFAIHDLVENHEPAGTKVIITIYATGNSDE